VTEANVSTVICLAIAAKLVASAPRRDYGFSTRSAFASARTGTQVDAAYLIAVVVSGIAVSYAGVRAGLVFAILLQAGFIVGSRLVLPGNHDYLDLLVALLCLRLFDDPAGLAVALQLVTATVWIYAAFQKCYHNEFVDGSFFYVALQENSRRKSRQWWTKYAPAIPPIEGFYGPSDPVGRSFCRRVAVLVVAAEILFPSLALVATNSAMRVGALLCLAVPIGLLTGETNFLITNLVLMLAFVYPFQVATLRGAIGDPVVLGILLWCAVWPPIHAVLTRYYRFTSWKLAGWGMFATCLPTVEIIDSRGEPVRSRGFNSVQFAILSLCGYCRLHRLRKRVARAFFRLCRPGQVIGVLFRWYRCRGEECVTDCVLLLNTADAVTQRFCVSDPNSESELRTRLLGLCIMDGSGRTHNLQTARAGRVY
jgi:hypothetical protein